jgi:hypothetical protein
MTENDPVYKVSGATRQAVLIKADGTRELVEPKNGEDFSREELQGFVDGYIEIVFCRDKKIMVLNEEGKLMSLPFNPEATKIFQDNFGDRDIIVGDVLYCDITLVK